MKKLYLFILLNITYLAYSQTEFITQWQVSTDLSITVPVVGTDNNYTIDFGDGTVLTNQTGAVSHSFQLPGIYTVTLSGDFNQIRFADYSPANAEKLRAVTQWGNAEWSSMNSAFYRCVNMAITATDSPNLTQVTDMSYMFFFCKSLNQSLNNWDVSNVALMKYTFYYATSFNQPLDNWDVSGVTNMDSMFFSATSFNQPLNSWDVSSVNRMYRMFYYATSFNQPLDGWITGNVAVM
ncbi:PKD domain-containing protein [Flavobacterium sp. D11R37]|nr:BspA family leucine-rich repeat surface protein [Flavobacterium coralii]MBY8962178.1 PKD domain-containing protein [Flavobacterium coralii]